MSGNLFFIFSRYIRIKKSTNIWITEENNIPCERSWKALSNNDIFENVNLNLTIEKTQKPETILSNMILSMRSFQLWWNNIHRWEGLEQCNSTITFSKTSNETLPMKKLKNSETLTSSMVCQ